MNKNQNETTVLVKNEVSIDDDDPPLIKNTLSQSGLLSTEPINNWLDASLKFPISDRSLDFIAKNYPNISLNDWNSWQWQFKNGITSLKALKQLLHLGTNEQQPLFEENDSLPLRITPYYASLLDAKNPEQAIRKSVIPSLAETILSEGEESDPLSEELCSPVPCIVHRYPDRVLFLATGVCSTYCRYCTRSHMVAKDKVHFGTSAWDQAIEYIKNHKEVRDVLISGGDPLTLPTSRIEYLLSRLRAISHVEIIRIGTKAPVVLPQRITTELTNVLKKYHPLFISIHFTHPDELTPEVGEACTRLANAGIPLGSQTVLLKGINDNVETMLKLMQGLLKIRVRPYYLYQCDPIPGSAHFRTPVEKGLEIIKGLRGWTSGYAIPHYVIDAPGGGGKIPLLPEYYQGRDEKGRVILKNYEDKTFYYPDYA
ncbi:MAG: KamA family radical SAM protein [Bacteroidales bacterium]|nr:KamA family radical SAM protein [Bacteroidales bacterium]HPD96081.1 KamA family radical SAM protein [Tenuifilaceae bacterium]HRX32174.1 KamA family radical SAM protein [Tenuifilaceae bacterium]